MQQTTNYNLNKFDSTDELEDTTRLGLNENADTIDTALKGIQDDIDGLDASEVSYDNTVSGLTATDVQAALDEELDKIDILSTDYIVDEGTSGIWTYRKWNSGIAECWGKDVKSTAITRSWGSFYVGDWGSVVFPFEFTTIESASIVTNGGLTSFIVNAIVGTTGITNIQCARGTLATDNVLLGFYAIGTWK